MIKEILKKYGLDRYVQQLENTNKANTHSDIWEEIIFEVGNDLERLIVDLAINNDFVGDGKYPFVLSYESSNDNILMLNLLLHFTDNKTSLSTKIEIAELYKVDIATKIRDIPMYPLYYPIEFIKVLSDELDWEHIIDKFDEYDSRKSNQMFKSMINECKENLFLDKSDSKTYRPANDSQMLKLLLLGLTFEEDEIRDIFNHETSLQDETRFLFKDIYQLDVSEIKKKYPIESPAHILKYNYLFEFKSHMEQIQADDLILQLVL